MSVTIVNKIPDLAERNRINLQVEEALDSSPISWHVRILPAAENDNVVRANAHRREFTKTFIGADGDLPASIRTFIEEALATLKNAEGSGDAGNSKESILRAFQLLSGTSAGIESWITESTDGQVLERLARIDSDPLSKVQLNQLLLLAREAGVSDGFFQYYFRRKLWKLRWRSGP